MQFSNSKRSPGYHSGSSFEIVNIHRLAQILLTSTSTIRKGWRRLPHFYVGEGCNLKSARFDVKKVINFLEKEAEDKCKNGTIQTQRQEEGMIRSVHAGRRNLQKRRVSNKVRSGGVGKKRTIPDKTPGAIDTNDDPFILAATDWELDFIQTFYHTLGRLSEILRLAWGDIDLEKRTVTLRTRKRKGGQIQSDLVPMSETLFSCLYKGGMNATSPALAFLQNQAEEFIGKMINPLKK